MSRRSRLGITVAALGAVAVAGLAVRGVIENRREAAHEAGRDETAQAPQRVSVVDGTPIITLDTAAQRADGIVTVTLNNAPHRERLRAYGSVLDLQPLTELANSYANAKARLAIAQAKLAATQAEFERADKLYKDRQNMSAAQFQAADSAFRIDRAGLAAAGSEMHTLALTAQQNWGPVLGQAVVDGGPLLDRLIGRQEVLLQVALRPGQAIAEPPEDASAQLDDGSDLKLRFVSAATKTDPRVQGLSFFLTAQADAGLLPGMSAVVFLSASRPVNGVVVPGSAVVWEQGRAWAYFRAGPETFARRALPTDLTVSIGGYLVRGIPDHAEVVVEGAQMLFSEEFRAQTRAGGLGDTD